MLNALADSFLTVAACSHAALTDFFSCEQPDDLHALFAAVMLLHVSHTSRVNGVDIRDFYHLGRNAVAMPVKHGIRAQIFQLVKLLRSHEGVSSLALKAGRALRVREDLLETVFLFEAVCHHRLAGPGWPNDKIDIFHTSFSFFVQNS